MKRKRTLAGAIVVLTGLGVAGCGGPPAAVEADIFASIEECVAKSAHGQALCEQQFSMAIDVHEASAPRHNSKAECEEKAGTDACEWAPTEDGERRFRARMQAFLIPFFNGAQAQPLYQAKGTAGYVTGNGVPLEARSGRMTVPFAAIRTPPPLPVKQADAAAPKS